MCEDITRWVNLKIIKPILTKILGVKYDFSVIHDVENIQLNNLNYLSTLCDENLTIYCTEIGYLISSMMDSISDISDYNRHLITEYLMDYHYRLKNQIEPKKSDLNTVVTLKKVSLFGTENVFICISKPNKTVTNTPIIPDISDIKITNHRYISEYNYGLIVNSLHRESFKNNNVNIIIVHRYEAIEDSKYYSVYSELPDKIKQKFDAIYKDESVKIRDKYAPILYITLDYFVEDKIENKVVSYHCFNIF